MRKIIYFIILLVILSTAASALKIFDTQESGRNLDFYYNTIVFETDEADLDIDLNNDGDTFDTVIRYYDTETEEVLNTEMAGKNPVVYAFYIVFESFEGSQDQDLNQDGDKEDTVIVYFHSRDKKTMSTTAIGYNPSIHGTELIAFSTPESEMGVDYNNDGDQEDNIIRYYKIATKEVVNTKHVGINPAITDRYILFETSEREFGEDLNKDEDTNDRVLRFYALETEKVVNTFEQGDKPEIGAEHLAAFARDGVIMYYDVPSQKLTDTKIEGSGPSVTGKLIAFSKDNKIAVYDAEKNVYAQTGMLGKNPVIFEDRIAFLTDEFLRYAVSENLDNDTVLDFADNCPEIANEDQKDSNDNGIGDACDSIETEKPKKEPKEEPLKQELEEPPKEERKPLPQPESFTVVKQKKGPGFFTWVLILIAIAIGVGLVVYAIIMQKKKAKGFGF